MKKDLVTQAYENAANLIEAMDLEKFWGSMADTKNVRLLGELSVVQQAIVETLRKVAKNR